MTRWETYRLLCRCIARCRRASPDLNLNNADWPALIEASSHHLVTPALAWSLSKNEDVPRDINEYLEAILVLNVGRNAILLDQLESVVGALNGIGIAPVLLKGAAVLAEQLHPHIGIRVLSDLDLLIPRDRSNDALECVRALGFADPKTSTWIEAAAHHLPTHVHPVTGTNLDLHVHAIPPWIAKLLPAEEVFAHAIPSSFRGTKALVPHPTHQIAHNIVHSQILHGLHVRGTVSLRWLLDFALSCRRYEAEIDWSELARRFRDTRNTPVLKRTVSLARELFSVPKSVPEIGTDRDALQILQHAVEYPRRQTWGIVALILTGHARLFRTAPYQYLSLLKLQTWPQRLATIRRILRTRPKW